MTSAIGSAPTFRLAQATSRDLSAFAPPTIVSTTHAGARGAVSPDITERADGTYVETYDGIPLADGPSGQDKLFYRTSRDLRHWSLPHRLMPALFSRPGDRLIDAALAWTPRGLILGYKYGLPDNGAQHFSIAWSRSGSLAGPWTYIGQPDITVYGDTIENYQFVRIDGVWQVLGTSNQLDRPWLFRLVGDPSDPQSWLHWSRGRELEVPLESWNRAVGIPGITFDQENSAYLCDARRLDGYFYLLYIGATELTTYGGFGHTKLGIARSKDLVVWSVPCGAGASSTPAGCT